jgi:RNA polymerase sigma factor (sigma-70 family)
MSSGEAAKRFLDALYRQYSRALLRFVSRQDIGTEEAKEIVQETYCRMHQVPAVESLESPRGYLFRTAINLTRDTKRQRRRDYSGPHDEFQDTDAVASEAPTAYQILNGKQELEIIRRAITELTPVCRQVFIMHRFENATYREIAAHFDLSVSMIEKYVSQALAHLKKSLDEAHRP